MQNNHIQPINKFTAVSIIDAVVFLYSMRSQMRS